jgi:hypothetical protein
MQVFREYYPTNKEFVTLECVWKTDKFVLVEKTHKIDVKGQDGGLGDGSIEKSVPRYWTIESFLGGNDIQGKILFWFLPFLLPYTFQHIPIPLPNGHSVVNFLYVSFRPQIPHNLITSLFVNDGFIIMLLHIGASINLHITESKNWKSI